jgi:hypothetical protein
MGCSRRNLHKECIEAVAPRFGQTGSVRLDDAIVQERHATAHVIALLMEVDARKLYAQQSCSSLFTYCVQILHFSEHAAYLRIEEARAARQFPAILDRLADGSLHLTAISLLAPHLTPVNYLELLVAAQHKSKRDVEQLVARVRPRPDAASIVRRLPAPQKAVASQFGLTNDAGEERNAREVGPNSVRTWF